MSHDASRPLMMRGIGNLVWCVGIMYSRVTLPISSLLINFRFRRSAWKLARWRTQLINNKEYEIYTYIYIYIHIYIYSETTDQENVALRQKGPCQGSLTNKKMEPWTEIRRISTNLLEVSNSTFV